MYLHSAFYTIYHYIKIKAVIYVFISWFTFVSERSIRSCSDFWLAESTLYALRSVLIRKEEGVSKNIKDCLVKRAL